MDDVKGTVRLSGAQMVEGNGPCHEVSKLEARRIGGFRDHYKLKRKRTAQGIRPIAKPPKGQFQFGILSFAALFNNNGSRFLRLPQPVEMLANTFQTRFQRIFIGSDRLVVSFCEGDFVDDDRNHGGG